MEKDFKNVEKVIKQVSRDEEKLEGLREEIEKRGLKSKTEEMGKKYASKLEEFVKENDVKSMNSEEKARIILEYKNKLSPEEKKKFDKIMGMAKSYGKRINKGGK